ncbi:MAG: hypothetical protein ACP5OR_06350 [Candidatus Dormibacteria bacterium]
MQVQQSTLYGSVPLSIEEVRTRADALFNAVEPSRRPLWNVDHTVLTYGESTDGISRATVVKLIPSGTSTEFELTFTQIHPLPRITGMQWAFDAMVKSGCQKLLALIGTKATTLRTIQSPRDTGLV